MTPWTIENSLGQNPGVGSLYLLQGIFPAQGSNPGLLHCRWILLPAEPQGKPKNTRVGSLSLLQWIFLTQELSRGLLHCRQILYQPSHREARDEGRQERESRLTTNMRRYSASPLPRICKLKQRADHWLASHVYKNQKEMWVLLMTVSTGKVF